MRKIILLFVCLFVIVSFAKAVDCGDSIFENQVLDQDLVCNETALIINADNIELDCDYYSIIGSGDDYGIYVNYSNNVTIEHCRIENFNWGIHLEYSDYCYLDHNDLEDNNQDGVVLYHGNYNTIKNSFMVNNYNNGIYFWYSDNNFVSKSKFRDNRMGALVMRSTYNTFWDNSFIANDLANAYEFTNAWNNSWNYGIVGNYWDDFSSNPGYPDNYIIDGVCYPSGPCGGVDYYPKVNPPKRPSSAIPWP